MITVSNVSLTFGGTKLFANADLKFLPGNCYGIIGANGARKSTFLRILSGELEPTTGEIAIQKGCRMSVLKQDQFQYDQYPVIDTVIMGNAHLYEVMKEKDALYEKPDFSEEDGARAAELEGEFAEMNGWDAETDSGRILSGLGISPDMYGLPMGELKGGDKVKVLLAQALFGQPDILLLDEPTNNLDIKSIDWLEDFLLDFPGTLIVVSHDRHFLNTCHLFCWTGDSSIADYYERALYNHILGQQDPETGMVAYFLPLLSGSHKLYSTKENSFWCCVGSGFENHAKFGEAIYYHNNQGIYVNLFIPSQVTWKEKGLTIRQETEFPQEETTRFTLQAENPVRTTIYLRYPSWSKDVKVSVNGKKISVKQKSGSYIAITREWKDGDQISATYPMQIKLETTPDNPDKAALLYGPLVLAGERGTEGMQAPAPFSNPALYNDYYTYNFHVPAHLRTSLKLDKKHPERALQRVGSDLKFTTEQGDVIRPLYDLHRQRYVVYWDLQSEE